MKNEITDSMDNNSSDSGLGSAFSGLIQYSGIFQILASLLLILSVMSAVHHSEIIAHRVGEPYGTIILAVAITVIEVSIIISLMMSGGCRLRY